MADVAKTYGVGDTVYVWYHEDIANQYTPKSRIVSEVIITGSSNQAIVKFSNGNQVIDGPTQRVFDTQAACATAIVTAVIAATAATVVLEGGAPTTLARA